MDIDLVDFDNLPEEFFDGFRLGVPDRLRAYLACLKDDGCGYRTAAASVGLGYETVRTARSRDDGFGALEKMAMRLQRHPVDKSVHNEASTGNVGAQVLYYKLRWAWKDGKQVELTGKDGKALKGIDPDDLSVEVLELIDRDLKVAALKRGE